MSTKVKVDTKLGQWGYAMRAKPLVDAGAYRDDSLEPISDLIPAAGTQARVVAQQGKTVNMRRTPNIKGSLIMRVPLGTIVNIIQPGEEWCKISYANKTGYMMAQFLDIM